MTLLLLTLQGVLARRRSWWVGLLAAGAAALLTPSLALVETIHDGTRRSLIESGAGHLQVYHSGSPETPVLLTGPGGAPELVPFEDFPATEALVRSVEGVQDVVPMEAGTASVFRGNYLDEKLAAVRAVTREPASEARDARLGRLAEDLRRTLERVAHDERQREQAFAGDVGLPEDRRTLEAVTADAFWVRFRTNPEAALEYLEERVAKLAGEGESLSLDYLGTDPVQFARAFPRFELLSGELPPPGSRGILLGQAAYEQNFKLPIALRLDELRREREHGGSFADERLKTQVERNLAELPDLLSRLDVERASALRATLVRVLGHEGELEPLLREFLSVEDGTFDTRYRLFYDELAPHLPLYRVRPGETLTLRNRLLSAANVPVRVWGTFRFRGLGGDTSQVNSTCLVDLVSARLLAGRQTREQQEEARALVAAFGMSKEQLSADTLGRPMIVDVEPQAPGAEAPVLERSEVAGSFSDEELRAGSVLHAAIVLRPGTSAEDVTVRLQRLVAERKQPLAIVSWEEVGGLFSGVVGISQLVLGVFAALLAFFVLLVATGTLLLLAKERVGEVGTLRAMGMQRREVFSSLLLEGLVLGGVGGLLGSGLGAALLLGLAGGGIPVSDDMLQFALGGAVLVPQLAVGHILWVVAGVLGVVMVASLVPAWRGSSVPPVVAMRRRED
ncbi:FtsX-like permease family protein [Archangium gephyra]|uniref:FtsX-like permease family protein n=1 Tax=Archangium gephyra TaxID=48 RepID=A0ABX9K6J8_9BACT|nr:FtsX-like permease family protein [Archangium gephyra]REG34356.1 FtsX-like permease family protein [Archangium gephyra]